MRVTLVAAAALLLASTGCVSSSEDGARREAGYVVVGPWLGDLAPDRFLVLWETSSAVPTRLWWGERAGTPSLVESVTPSTRHEALVAGLLPDTAYWYRIDDGGAARGAIPVRTRSAEARSIRIAVLGDTHSTRGVHARIVTEVIAEHPDLVIHTGDLSLRAGKGETDAEGHFFSVEGPLLRSVPIYPVLGNHDGIGSRFVDLFVRPRGAGDEAYYLARWGPLALVALDTNQPLGPDSDQGRWLARTLESLAGDAGVVFRVVAMHWGPFESGSGHGSNLEAREALVPLFERWGVDVVFSGHDHVYERGTVHGVRYVTTGGGGGAGAKPHEVLGGAWTEAASSAPHHGVLEVEGRELRFTAREARTGRILDEFRIVKEPAAPVAERPIG